MHQHHRLNAGLSENGIPNRVIESDLFTSISVDVSTKFSTCLEGNTKYRPLILYTSSVQY